MSENAIQNDPNRLVSIEESALLLGLSIVQVRKLYYTGKLPQPIRIAGGRKLAYRYKTLLDVQEQWANA